MARAQKSDSIQKLAARVDAIASEKNCAAVAIPLVAPGILNRCPRPCTRCARLRKEIDAAAPERERLHQEWRAAHPEPTPRPPVPVTDDWPPRS